MTSVSARDGSFHLDAQRYLSRIGIHDPLSETPLTFDFLWKVQLQSLYNIPHENIAVALGKPIRLDMESLSDKIIDKQCGGFCFEINHILYHALIKMGFSCRQVLGRVIIDGVVSALTHIMTLVDIDEKKYLVDVGFGPYTIRKPMLVKHGQTEICPPGETFRVIEDEKYLSSGYTIQKKIITSRGNFFEECGEELAASDEWEDLISFDMSPVFDEDLECGNFFSYTYPGNIFTEIRSCCILTEDGRITLRDQALTVFKGNKAIENRVLPEDDSYFEILRQYFNIRYDAMGAKYIDMKPIGIYPQQQLYLINPTSYDGLDVSRALQRIGMSHPPPPPAAVRASSSLRYLTEIMVAHQRTVPFENFNVALGRKVKLDLPSLHRKIVHERRGGNCFELNLHFYHVLQALGFDCRLLIGRVLVNGQPTARTYLMLLVDAYDDCSRSSSGSSGSFDQSAPIEPDMADTSSPRRTKRQYIVDVGFGSYCLRKPLLFSPNFIDHDQYPETFRLIHDERFLSRGFTVQRYRRPNKRVCPAAVVSSKRSRCSSSSSLSYASCSSCSSSETEDRKSADADRSGEVWEDLVSFNLSAVYDKDIKCGNHYVSMYDNPSNYFYQSRLCCLLTEHGRITLKDKTLSYFEGSGGSFKRGKSLKEGEEYLSELERVFGLNFGEEVNYEDLKPLRGAVG